MLLNIPTIIGLISILLFAKGVINFIYIYTRPSSLPRYLQPDSWALVTGATEGIGRALARELAFRGFNVVLHGRNRSKLNSSMQDLSTEFPALKFRTVVADAVSTGSSSATQISDIVRELSDIKLKILINNVGGPPSSMVPRYKSFDLTTTKDNDEMLAMNVGFSTQLTAALLPALLKNQPSLVLTMGSMAVYGSPWLSMYSGSKAFLMAWGRGLAREMKAEGRDVEVLGIVTGEVTGCSHNSRPATLIMPDSKVYAKAVLDRVGCGQAVVNGYWSQGILRGIVDLLPEFILTPMFIGAMEKQRAEYAKDM
ncbi:3-ketoacyl-reductase [Hyphodiscus hymeniophilus]|uniref:3-ketoacyl-reductase n=1 Tax=Hyphodiscus hymeniophilus TaxID=353542 RepID=A0A9P6VID8_9HELO|nr:3-ketoacyl-reductase [Hyphodiscus hymeniophilus]